MVKDPPTDPAADQTTDPAADPPTDPAADPPTTEASEGWRRMIREPVRRPGRAPRRPPIKPLVKPPVIPATRRRLPAAERRQVILDAAIDAFADTGYHETSLEEVGRRAGVSKALIYEHFPSKQELYGEILETYVHELLDRVSAAAMSIPEGGELRLIAGIEGFLEFVDERRDAWRMLIRHRANDDVADSFERLIDEVAAMIGSLMAEEMPPSIRPEGVEFELVVDATSRQLVGSIIAIANWWDERREIPRGQVLAMIMEFAWVGLERAAAGERWNPASLMETPGS